MTGFRPLIVCALTLAATASVAPVGAQAVSVVHAFPPSPTSVSELMQTSDGTFYGIGSTEPYSPHRAIFRMKPGGRPTIVHVFRGEEGEYPRSLIQGKDGDLYGVTGYGGAHDGGNVFKMRPDGTVITLYSFGGTEQDGEYPVNLLEATDGNFYGVTSDGGPAAYGTAFRMTPTGIVTILHAFNANDVEGGVPMALIQATDGNFYGTTRFTFGRGQGAAFRMSRDGVVTVLHEFDHVTTPLMQAADGYFYGAASIGSSYAVFRMSSDGAVTRLCGL